MSREPETFGRWAVHTNTYGTALVLCWNEHLGAWQTHAEVERPLCGSAISAARDMANALHATDAYLSAEGG